MSETSWVLVGKGESITSGGDVWTYNSLKFYPRNIGKNYWIFAVPNSKFDSASIDTSYLGNKDIKMLHLSVI
jgi:hypothetical protein